MPAGEVGGGCREDSKDIWEMTLSEEELLGVAFEAVAAAMEAIMGIYRAGGDFGVVQKEDNTPVTRADMASNRAIIGILERTGIPILSEETAHESYAVRRGYEWMWVVDPLDGTKEFIKRNDMFSVCIALVRGHRAVMGVIGVPVTGQVYYTRGGGAWRGVVGEGGSVGGEVRLPVTYGPVPHVVLGSVSHPGAATERVVAALRGVEGWEDTRLVAMGSSIKQCMIAEGSAAVYPRQGTTMEWDTAAGQAIVEASGGVLVRASDGVGMLYNRARLRNPDFVAVAAGVGREVLEVARGAVRG